MSAVTLIVQYLSTSREKFGSYIQNGAPTGNLLASMSLTLRKAFFVSEAVVRNQHLSFTTSELVSSLVSLRVDIENEVTRILRNPCYADTFAHGRARFHKKLDGGDGVARQEWHT
jgi:hypothetical protein